VSRALAALALVALTLPARADEPDFELVRAPTPPLHAGAQATLSLSLVPRAGRHLLAGGPVQLRLHGDGVRPARARYDRDDAVDPRADVPRFELAITGERAGPAKLDADVLFYLCTAANADEHREARCRPVEARATWSIEILRD
jgi:hypothetical protein